jgi:hypothetical protein
MIGTRVLFPLVPFALPGFSGLEAADARAAAVVEHASDSLYDSMNDRACGDEDYAPEHEIIGVILDQDPTVPAEAVKSVAFTIAQLRSTLEETVDPSLLPLGLFEHIKELADNGYMPVLVVTSYGFALDQLLDQPLFVHTDRSVNAPGGES